MAADPWAAFQEVKPKDDPWAGFEDLGQAPAYVEPTVKNILHGYAVGIPEQFKQWGLGQAQKYLDWAPGANDSPERAQMRSILEQKDVESRARQAAVQPTFDTYVGRGVYSSVNSAAQQLPGMAMSLLTRNPIPGLAYLGSMTEGEAYGRYKGRGATREQAALGTGIETATEVGTELMPLNFAVNKLGRVGFGEFLAGTLGREVPGEALATLIQSASDAAIANPNMTLKQWAHDQLGQQGETFVATVAQALLFAGAGSAAHRLSGAQPGPQNLNDAREQFRQNAGLGQPVTDLTATPPPGGGLGAPQLEGPPGSIRPPAPDFVVDPYGRAVRPGEALPEDRALPAPQPSGEWQVTPAGVVSPITQTQAQGLGQARQERADLGLGQADRLQYQAAQKMVPAQRVAAQRDLFASPTEAASLERRNSLAAEQARRAKVQDVPLETGDATDLFSQARNQVDLMDVPPKAPEIEPWNEPRRTPMERLATDRGLREQLTTMKQETGWSQVGGRLLIDQATGRKSRTQWLPRNAWFQEKPAFASERMVQSVIDKMLSGTTLYKREQQVAEWLAGVADERDQQANPPLMTAEELRQPLASRSTTVAPITARRGRVDVAAAIAPVVQRWGANAPGLNIVENASQLPDAVRSQVGEDVLGATDLGTGQVYLNSALIHSPEEAQRVLAHEAVGHYGMQRMLGERWGTVLGEVANLAKTQPELAKIAEGVTRDYPGVDADTHAAEVIGRFAETNPQHPFVKRVVAWLREALRNMGFAVKLSHNDLIAMLRRAAKYNEGGGVIGTTIKDGVLAMTVYHGSPHNFDAFDMSKIGTGEGAQAYGHGLYVAEKRGVAESYVPHGSNQAVIQYVDKTGSKFIPKNDQRRYLDESASYLYNQHGSANAPVTDAMIKSVQSAQSLPGLQNKLDVLDGLKLRQELGLRETVARTSGALYHVDLPDSHIANMLDWDAPLSQQPQILEKLRKAGLVSGDQVQGLEMARGSINDISGQQVIDDLATQYANDYGLDGLLKIDAKNGREAASKYLNSIGIPGIKYWDGGSRAAGNGTRNYVVFDDKILTITHKNGEPVTPKERSQVLAARPEGMSRQSTATGTNAPQQQPESPPWAGASQSTVNEAGKLETGGGTYSMAPVSGLDPGAQQALLDVMSADTGQSRVARQRGNGGEPVTWAMNGQAAQVLLNSKLGPLYRDLVNRVPHTAANAAKMEALSSFVVAQGQRLWEAQQRYNQTGAHEDLVRVMAEGEKLAMLQAPMMGYWTEAGRSLNIIRKVQQETANARALLDALGDGSEGAARAFSERLKGARTVADVLNVTKAAYQPNALDMFREFWINGLLSGPWTHVVNTVSNSLYMGLESGARLATSVVSPNVSTRAELARFSGWLAGANLGIANAAKAFMTEEPQLSGTRQIDSPKMRAIPGEVGRLVRVPGRALMAMDEFAKAVNYTGALHEMAMEEAIKRNPANPHEVLGSILAGYANDTAAQDKAKAFADRMTFQTQLGEHGRSLMAAREKVPGAWAIVPFVRTPTNIVKEFAKFTPAGAAMPSVIADLKSGNAKARDLAIGRMAVGTAIMGTVAALTAAGMITGAGPDDPRERELWLRTGRLPYAFKNPITGEWQRYNRFEPFAMLVGISADLSEISREFGREDKTALQKAEAAGNLALGSFMTNLGDKTFLRGVTDFSQMVSDPTRFAGQWASGMAGTLIPNILAQGARIDDPYLRDARGIVDSLRSRVPGARESLPHKLDIAGEPIQGSRFEPSASSAPRNDPLAEAMLAVGAIKGSPGRSITLQGHRYDLTSEEYEDYKAFLQQTRWAALTPVAASPQFKALARDDSLKAKDLLERQWDKIGSEARDIWLVRHPEVIRKIASQRVTPEGSSYLNQ